MKKFSEFLELDMLLEQILLNEYAPYQDLENEKDRRTAMLTFVTAQKKFMMKKILNGEADNAMDAVRKFSDEFRKLYNAGMIDLMTGEVLPEPAIEAA